MAAANRIYDSTQTYIFVLIVYLNMRHTIWADAMKMSSVNLVTGWRGSGKDHLFRTIYTTFLTAYNTVHFVAPNETIAYIGYQKTGTPLPQWTSCARLAFADNLKEETHRQL